MSKPGASSAVASFDDKTFDNAMFRGAEFPARVTFRNCRFNGKTDFSGAKFKDVVEFTGSQFLGEADFSGVDFGHNAVFSGAQFAARSDFSNSVFHAWGLFNKSSVKAEAVFAGTRFNGSANFSEVEFAADADFRESRFITYADFHNAGFSGKAEFANASIECKTIFREATFSKDADFTDCRFTHPLNFSGANFQAAANFDRVILLQFTDFKEARLHDSFILSPPNGSQGLAPEVRFESVTLDQPAMVRFQNISFEKITLMGTNLRRISFENPKWPRRGLFQFTKRAVVYDEIQKEKPEPQKLAQLYRDIRVNLKKAGTTADLGDLLYSEMEVRRKQRRGASDSLYFFRRYLSPYTLLWLTCGYGRRPLRAAIVVGLAALAYWW